MQGLEGAAIAVLQAAEAAKAQLQVKVESLHSSHQDYERKVAEVSPSSRLLAGCWQAAHCYHQTVRDGCRWA